jgi:hypothetical protein
MDNWQIKLKTEQEIGSRSERKTEEQTDNKSEINGTNRKNDKITRRRQRERKITKKRKT